jgi:hypothetical protein
MTALRLFESIKLPVTFDESSITDQYNGKPLDPIVKDFKLFATLWLKAYGNRICSLLEMSTLVAYELSFRFKSGPLGPSILTSHLDAIAI